MSGLGGGKLNMGRKFDIVIRVSLVVVMWLSLACIYINAVSIGPMSLSWIFAFFCLASLVLITTLEKSITP